MLTYVLFLVGFVLLIKGADLLTEGGSAIAKNLGVSDLAIGLTLVSFGTSLPEFVVNIIASLEHNSGIAIGNILGSNIANVLLILGVSAVISPVVVRRKTVWVEIPFSCLAAVVLGILANDALIDGAPSSVLTRSDGFILLSFFLVFMAYIIAVGREDAKNEVTEERKSTVFSAVLMAAGGSLALFVGGKWVVEGGVHLAVTLGMSQSVIGLTIVALGTSLPELATCVVASRKNSPDIAIGNVVGSNIFNIFWILGCSSVIQAIPLENKTNIDLAFTIFVSALLFLTVFIGKKRLIGRWKGVGFVLLYLVYMVLAFFRQPA
jgi:cation:H+ antiporter